jgi:hypothetical protein
MSLCAKNNTMLLCIHKSFQTPCISKCVVPSTPSTVTQITTQSTPVRTSCVQSTPRPQQKPGSSLNSSTYLDPTLASLLLRKTRIMCDIYNEDATNSFLVFSLFSQIDDPLNFQEEVKEDVWAQAMDE